MRVPAAVRRVDFRILITGALIAALCGAFWLGSRYPSLQGKATADPNEALSTPLGFERHFPEPPSDQTLKHIGWTAMEWADPPGRSHPALCGSVPYLTYGEPNVLSRFHANPRLSDR